MANERYKRLFNRIAEVSDVPEEFITAVVQIVGTNVLTDRSFWGAITTVNPNNGLNALLIESDNVVPAIVGSPDGGLPRDALRRYLWGGWTDDRFAVTPAPGSPGQVIAFRSAVRDRTSYEVDTGGDAYVDPMSNVFQYVAANGLPAPS